MKLLPLLTTDLQQKTGRQPGVVTNQFSYSWSADQRKWNYFPFLPRLHLIESSAILFRVSSRIPYIQAEPSAFLHDWLRSPDPRSATFSIRTVMRHWASNAEFIRLLRHCVLPMAFTTETPPPVVLKVARHQAGSPYLGDSMDQIIHPPLFSHPRLIQRACDSKAIKLLYSRQEPFNTNNLKSEE